MDATPNLAIKPDTPQHRLPEDQQPEKKDEEDIFQNIEKNQEKQRFPLLAHILEHTAFNIFITLLTIFTLFGSDLKTIVFDKRADPTFDIISFIALSFFTIEIVFSILTKPGYVFGFFFWLDIISTLSILLDISIVNTAIGLSRSSTTNTASLARAGRASRVGTKAGRVVRLVRLIRIVKLYKAASKENKRGVIKKSKYKSKRNITNENKQDPEQENYQELRESRVSKRLSDLTTKRVIVIVLLLLLVMPLFTSDYYFDPPKTLDFSLYLMRDISQSNSTRQQIKRTWTQVIDQHTNIESPLAFLDAPLLFLPNFKTSSFQYLRDDDVNNLMINPSVVGYLIVWTQQDTLPLALP